MSCVFEWVAPKPTIKRILTFVLCVQRKILREVFPPINTYTLQFLCSFDLPTILPYFRGNGIQYMKRRNMLQEQVNQVISYAQPLFMSGMPPPPPQLVAQILEQKPAIDLAELCRSYNWLKKLNALHFFNLASPPKELLNTAQLLQNLGPELYHLFYIGIDAQYTRDILAYLREKNMLALFFFPSSNFELGGTIVELCDICTLLENYGQMQLILLVDRKDDLLRQLGCLRILTSKYAYLFDSTLTTDDAYHILNICRCLSKINRTSAVNDNALAWYHRTLTPQQLQLYLNTLEQANLNGLDYALSNQHQSFFDVRPTHFERQSHDNLGLLRNIHRSLVNMGCPALYNKYIHASNKLLVNALTCLNTLGPQLCMLHSLDMYPNEAINIKKTFTLLNKADKVYLWKKNWSPSIAKDHLSRYDIMSNAGYPELYTECNSTSHAQQMVKVSSILKESSLPELMARFTPEMTCKQANSMVETCAKLKQQHAVELAYVPKMTPEDASEQINILNLLHEYGIPAAFSSQLTEDNAIKIGQTYEIFSRHGYADCYFPEALHQDSEVYVTRIKSLADAGLMQHFTYKMSINKMEQMLISYELLRSENLKQYWTPKMSKEYALCLIHFKNAHIIRYYVPDMLLTDMNRMLITRDILQTKGQLSHWRIDLSVYEANKIVNNCHLWHHSRDLCNCDTQFLCNAFADHGSCSADKCTYVHINPEKMKIKKLVFKYIRACGTRGRPVNSQYIPICEVWRDTRKCTKYPCNRRHFFLS